jgi:hypothetical protein
MEAFFEKYETKGLPCIIAGRNQACIGIADGTPGAWTS